MTLEDVRKRVEAIGAAVAREADEECLHIDEDELYHDVLQAIAEGTAEDPKAMAAEALRVRKMDFARWYA